MNKWNPDMKCFEDDNQIDELAYFAAHAPEVPDWFMPKMDTPRPKAMYDENDKNREWGAVNDDEISQWDKQYLKEKFFQWPWYYATEVLKRRGDNYGN
jgi:hypothetical protein